MYRQEMPKLAKQHPLDDRNHSEGCFGHLQTDKMSSRAIAFTDLLALGIIQIVAMTSKFNH